MDILIRVSVGISQPILVVIVPGAGHIGMPRVRRVVYPVIWNIVFVGFIVTIVSICPGPTLMFIVPGLFRSVSARVV